MSETGDATTTQGPPAPPLGPPARPPLLRPREGRMFLGVCAGLGRSTDVDPVIYRVLFVVLTIFGGLGLVVYGLAWLFIPEEGSGLSEVERLLRRSRHRHHPGLLALVIAVAAVVWLASVIRHGHDLAVSIVVIALLGYLVLRDRATPVLPPPADSKIPPAAADTSTATDNATAPDEPAPTWWSHPAPGATVPRWTPAPQPPRSRLGGVTLSLALVVAGALIAVREAGVHDVSVTGVLAATVLVVGLGLVVGSVVGRARWLALPGGALAVALLALVGIGIPIDNGVGDRTWDPATLANSDYHLGIGHGRLDLRDLPLHANGPVAIQASVAVGQLEVLVPDNVQVGTLVAGAAVGHIDVFGEKRDGVHPQLSIASSPGAGSTETVDLHLRVGAGDVEVRHVAR